MTPKAIEMPVQLQTGIVVFVKGAVGHSVASYIQSIHLCRIQCGNSILDSFVYGHEIPFHLIFAFSCSSAIIITAPGGGHSAGRLWRKTVIALMLPVSGQFRASPFRGERLSKYHCILQAVFAFRSYRLQKRKLRWSLRWSGSPPEDHLSRRRAFCCSGLKEKYLYHGVWNCQAAGGAGKTLSLKY